MPVERRQRKYSREIPILKNKRTSHTWQLRVPQTFPEPIVSFQ